MTCDRFNIQRKFVGTDPNAPEHTGTGLVESYIRLIKATALKTKRDMVGLGIEVKDEDVVCECCMAQ